jgi:hypothetical protein
MLGLGFLGSLVDRHFSQHLGTSIGPIGSILYSGRVCNHVETRLKHDQVECKKFNCVLSSCWSGFSHGLFRVYLGLVLDVFNISSSLVLGLLKVGFRSIGDWLKAYLGLVCNLLKLCLRMFTVSLRWDILFKDTMSDVHLKNTCMYVYINMIV